MTTDSPGSPSGPDYRAILFRALFMILFFVLYSIAELVVYGVAIVQLGFAIFTGEPQPRLTQFGAQLGTYVYQIMQYWTYNSEQKPFPFADWPSGDALS